MTLTALEALLSDLEKRLASLERARGSDTNASEGVSLSRRASPARPASCAGSIAKSIQDSISEELRSRRIEQFRFVRVPDDYYDRDLEYRRCCLETASIQHLCKTIVLENTKAPPEFRDCGGFGDSRYYCVIVQYAARLHADKLKRHLHKLNGRLGIKHFNMRLAPPEVSAHLTGFTHNAVTPFCMRTRLPVCLSHLVPRLEPDVFWLGAGETDLKVGMSHRQFAAAYKPLVLDCTYGDLPASANCLSQA